MKTKNKMERDERWEVNYKGELCISIPADTSKVNNKEMLKKMLSQNGWKCTIEEHKGCYYKVKIENDEINALKVLNIYFANIRKEDPDRNREEKKIQLGAGKDPREHTDDPTIILGIYVYSETDDINEAVITAWPVEPEKNYGKNPSLRVNMKKNIQKAKINGIHIDTTTGKKIISFRPEFIFYYIENFKNLHENCFEANEIKDEIDIEEEQYEEINKPYNRILFGAPGTGKSHTIDKDRRPFKENYERVTFHPNYSFAQFVGSYKPIAKEKEIIKGDEIQKEEFISYEFVPGPFTRVLINSLKNRKVPNLLIIEEINRANPAGVFGDIFQLLDRDKSGISKYTIDISEEMKKYINSKLEGDHIEKLYIPENMYIWTTMNSADQGVYPMDSAFKRRWSFEYLHIDAGEEVLKSKECNIIHLKNGPKKDDYAKYEWNEVRKAINNNLGNLSVRINEDKLLGPFFLSESELKSNQDEFDNIFKSKVLMYLFEDVLKHKQTDFFTEGVESFSKLVEAYNLGHVFKFDIKVYNEECEVNITEDMNNNENNNNADEY